MHLKVYQCVTLCCGKLSKPTITNTALITCLLCLEQFVFFSPERELVAYFHLLLVLNQDLNLNLINCALRRVVDCVDWSHRGGMWNDGWHVSVCLQGSSVSDWGEVPASENHDPPPPSPGQHMATERPVRACLASGWRQWEGFTEGWVGKSSHGGHG